MKSLRTLPLFALSSLLAAIPVFSSCSSSRDNDVTIRLPSRLASLTNEDKLAIRVTLTIPGVLTETELEKSKDLTEATGTFKVDSANAGTHDFQLRVVYEPEGAARVALAEQSGKITIAANQDNVLEATADWDSCGTVSEDGACAARFDLNRNAATNLEDLIAGIDPTPPPPFVDVAPNDLTFPSGIRLGSFARQVIVVENTSGRPVRASASIIDAPGATLQLFETNPSSSSASRRTLDLGTLDPFAEVLVAVSFAPSNPFLTVGDIFVEAVDTVSNVRQATRVRVLANVDGELQPPPPPDRYTPPDPALVQLERAPEQFSTASLFNGLPVTSTAGDSGSVAGLVYTGSTLTANFTADGVTVPQTVPVDHAFLVGVPAEHKLAVSLSGLETDVDLTVFLLEEDGSISDDPARNFSVAKAGASAEAIELDNESGAAHQALVVLGRVELEAPPEAVGALSADEPAPFSLSCHVTSTPEFTAPAAVIGQDSTGLRALLPPIGPLEGGSRLELRGRRFSPLARVTFGDARATECAFREEPPETIFECTVPAGSLLVGKNPATIVVANPEQDEGGDGQAASLPEGFTYEPPAPRLDVLLPAAAPSTGSTIPIQMNGAFFSTRNGPPRVFFGNVEATRVEFVDSTRMKVFAPSQSAGIVAVYAQNRLEPVPDVPDVERLSLPSNVRSFTYSETPYDSPTITAVSPVDGSIDGGTSVTLTGSGFRAGALVLFGDVVVEARDVSVLSATEIRCDTPAGANAGPVEVTVINDDGQAGSQSQAFSYFIPSPSIAELSPGVGSVDGGTVVLLSGTGFRAGVRVDFVLPTATIQALNVNRVSTTTLLVSTPSVTDGGTATVRVINVDGQTAELAGGFRFVAPDGPPPRVDTITPNAGDREVEQVVRIEGAEFRSPSVLVGSRSATVVTSDATSIEFVMPTSGSSGPAVVRVINDDGQTDTIVYTYFTVVGNAPVIQSITPPVARRGDAIVINGAYFDLVTDAEGASIFHPNARLFVGGQLINPEVIGDNQLRVIVPDLDTALRTNGGGAVAVEIINSDGQRTTGTFTYVLSETAPAPVIDAIVPSTVVLTQSTPVTLRGSGFQEGGSLAVGGETVALDIVTSDQIVFTAGPRDQTGTFVVRLTNPDGQQAAINLTYALAPDTTATPPRIDSISPDSCKTSGGATITLVGSNFDEAGTLFVGTAAVAPSERVGTSLVRFTCPASSAAGTSAEGGLVSVRYANPGDASASVPFRYVSGGTNLTPLSVGYIEPDVLHAKVAGDVVTLLGQGFTDGMTVTIETGDGSPLGTATPFTRSGDYLLQIRVNEPLEPNEDVVFRVTRDSDQQVTISPTVAARLPIIVGSSGEATKGPILIFGDYFNSENLAAVELGSPKSIVPLELLQRTDTFLQVDADKNLAPGASYNVNFVYTDFTGASVTLQPDGSPSIDEDPLPLDASRFNEPLPANSSPANLRLVGDILDPNAPAAGSDGSAIGFAAKAFDAGIPTGTAITNALLDLLNDPVIGIPTTFRLLDGSGGQIGSGTWTLALTNGVVDGRLELDFTSTAPIAPGDYSVELATTATDRLAVTAITLFGGVRFVDRAVANAFPPVVKGGDPQTVTSGGPLSVNGAIFAGDQVVAELVGSSPPRVVVLGTVDNTQCDREQSGCSYVGGFVMPNAPPELVPGTWRVCTVAADAAPGCPAGASPNATVDVVDTLEIKSVFSVGSCSELDHTEITGFGGRGITTSPTSTYVTGDFSSAVIAHHPPTPDGVERSVQEPEPNNDPSVAFTLGQLALTNKESIVAGSLSRSGSGCTTADDCRDRLVFAAPDFARVRIRFELTSGSGKTQVTLAGGTEVVADGSNIFLSSLADGVTPLVMEAGIFANVPFVVQLDFLEAGQANYRVSITPSPIATAQVTPPIDTLIADGATGKIYTLANVDNVPIQRTGTTSVADRLLQLDPNTLELTLDVNGQPIFVPLSQTIPISTFGENAVFSGENLLVLYAGFEHLWYIVDLTTGRVDTPINAGRPADMRFCNGGAAWGYAETLPDGTHAVTFWADALNQGDHLLTLVVESQRTSVAANFPFNLNSCGIGASPADNQWYVDFTVNSGEITGQRLGICPASFFCGDGTCKDGETFSTCPQDCVPVCGNNLCEAPGETFTSCPTDCRNASAVCGNGECDFGETNCSLDCSSGTVCGDRVCTSDEPRTCPQDCAAPPEQCGDGLCTALEASQGCRDCAVNGPVCGNRICEGSIESELCPTDCPAAGGFCGDGTCSGDESFFCREDCGPICQDGLCEAFEPNTCAQDCPVCGDQQCGFNEPSTCPQDCFGLCGDLICDFNNFGETQFCAEDCSVINPEPSDRLSPIPVSLNFSLVTSIDVAGDRDCYQFNVTEPVQVIFENPATDLRCLSASFDPVLRLLDANGNQLAHNDDFIPVNSGQPANFCARINTALDPNTYSICVEKFLNNGSLLDVPLSARILGAPESNAPFAGCDFNGVCDEPGGENATVCPDCAGGGGGGGGGDIDSNTRSNPAFFTLPFSTVTDISPASDEDCFAFFLPATTSVRLETSGAAGGCSADTFLTLFDQSLGQIGTDDDGGADTCSLLVKPLIQGNYVACVTTFLNRVEAFGIRFTVDTCDSDGFCEATQGETNAGCPIDCAQPPNCNNDGNCDALLGENSSTCPSDCGITVGSCTTDADCPSGTACLGGECVSPCNNNGTCDASETTATCPNDCPNTTSDLDGNTRGTPLSVGSLPFLTQPFEIAPGDEDCFAFSLSQTTSTLLKTTGTSPTFCPGDTVLNLFQISAPDGFLTQVGSNDNGNLGFCSELDLSLDTGSYLACVTARTGTTSITGVVLSATSCGNGTVEGSEECDDGNPANGDGCSSSCVVEPGFSCSFQPSTCTAVCGDGTVVGLETCDDGNIVSGDGCDALCAAEPGFFCAPAGGACTPDCGNLTPSNETLCADLDGDGVPSFADCNDNDPAVGGTEIPGDGIDQDCSGPTHLVFDPTGALQTFTVPNGITSIDVRLWGAGGGQFASAVSVLSAGTGGFTSTPMQVFSGETLTITVGGTGLCPALSVGGFQLGGAGGFGGGGDGGDAFIQDVDNDNAGCGGGGASRIDRSNGVFVVAGGGGGAGAGDATGTAGDGGGTVGGTGSDVNACFGNGSGGGAGAGGGGGSGGTGGIGCAEGVEGQGNGLPGTTTTGGKGGSDLSSGRSRGGGGGGGGFGGGGGGGASDSWEPGPGGGGGGFTLIDGTTESGSVPGEPGNATDPERGNAGEQNTGGRVILILPD